MNWLFGCRYFIDNAVKQVLEKTVIFPTSTMSALSGKMGHSMKACILYFQRYEIYLKVPTYILRRWCTLWLKTWWLIFLIDAFFFSWLFSILSFSSDLFIFFPHAAYNVQNYFRWDAPVKIQDLCFTFYVIRRKTYSMPSNNLGLKQFIQFLNRSIFKYL